MLLTVDIGNTQTTLGLFNEAGQLLRQWRMASDKTDTQLKEQLERAEDRVGKKRGGIGSFLGGIVNGVLSVAGALVGIG